MTRVLRGSLLEKFIEEFLNDYEEEIVNVVIYSDEVTTYVINGIDRFNINYDLVKKYLV